MRHSDPHPTPLRLLVAGGGVAALEAVLAVRELAGDRVATTVLSPGPDYTERALAVREPFAYAPAPRHDLATLVEAMGAVHVASSLTWVDPVLREVHTADGSTLGYDMLVLAVGARMHAAYPHASTIDDRLLDELLHGVVQDVEGGYVHRIAFVMPEHAAWPLPLYELALLTAARAYDVSARLEATLVTPEVAPLEVFGTAAGDAVAGLLEAAGVTLVTGVRAGVPDSRTVVLGPGRPPLQVDRVIALPELYGPAIRGVPGGAHGFIPVDPYCRVIGMDRILAIGDGCDHAIKHGGVAAQQAATAAAVVAQRAGTGLAPEPLRAELHGKLLTGDGALYLTARAAPSGRGYASRVSQQPLWDPAAKVNAPHLTAFLAARAAGAAR